MARRKKHTSSIQQKLLESISQIEKNKIREKIILADKISQAIIRKGLNKSQFAELIGCTNSTVTKWLSGTHNFTYDTITEIETILKIKLKDEIIIKYVKPSFRIEINTRTNNKIETQKHHKNHINSTIVTSSEIALC